MFQHQLETDMKIMLDPENINKKAVLKPQNYEIRLPLITKKRPVPVSNFYVLWVYIYWLFIIKVNTCQT